MKLSHNYYVALWAKSKMSAVVLTWLYTITYVQSFMFFSLLLLYALIVLISLFLYTLIWILLSSVSLHFALWVAQQAPSFQQEGRHWKKYIWLFFRWQASSRLLQLASCKFISLARSTANWMASFQDLPLPSCSEWNRRAERVMFSVMCCRKLLSWFLGSCSNGNYKILPLDLLLLNTEYPGGIWVLLILSLRVASQAVLVTQKP